MPIKALLRLGVGKGGLFKPDEQLLRRLHWGAKAILFKESRIFSPYHGELETITPNEHGRRLGMKPFQQHKGAWLAIPEKYYKTPIESRPLFQERRFAVEAAGKDYDSAMTFKTAHYDKKGRKTGETEGRYSDAPFILLIGEEGKRLIDLGIVHKSWGDPPWALELNASWKAILEQHFRRRK